MHILTIFSCNRNDHPRIQGESCVNSACRAEKTGNRTHKYLGNIALFDREYSEIKPICVRFKRKRRSKRKRREAVDWAFPLTLATQITSSHPLPPPPSLSPLLLRPSSSPINQLPVTSNSALCPRSIESIVAPNLILLATTLVSHRIQSQVARTRLDLMREHYSKLDSTSFEYSRIISPRTGITNMFFPLIIYSRFLVSKFDH